MKFFEKQLLKQQINQLQFENQSLKMSLEKQADFIKKFILFFSNIMSGHDKSQITSKHISNVASMVEDFFRIIPREYFEGRTRINYEIFKNSVILGAYLHDLGKFHISEDIINKPGKLTEEEFELIRRHPTYGSIDLIALPIDEDRYDKVVINNIVLHHHSNNDGSGYPDGLTEEQIPFEAKIVAVFDRLEAMMAKRSYKEPKSLETSLSILEEENKVDLDILKLVRKHNDAFIKYEQIKNTPNQTLGE